MSPDSDMQDLLMGFFGMFETPAKDGLVGGILITDFRGVPQEFRCTHPVRPTSVQKLLYGKTLEHHVGVSLCGEPLLQSVQNKPSLILVNKEFLLDVRVNSYCPVAYAHRAGEAIEVRPAEGSESRTKRERIIPSSGRFQPIIVDCHPEFGDDIVPAANTVEAVFTYFDPIEPFERMDKAIEVLGKQSKWFD